MCESTPGGEARLSTVSQNCSQWGVCAVVTCGLCDVHQLGSIGQVTCTEIHHNAKSQLEEKNVVTPTLV